ncbi:MAG: ABC transporter permease [Reyranellaceae bacterium]
MTTPAPAIAPEIRQRRPLRRLLAGHVGGSIGVLLLIVIFGMTLLAPLLAPYDPASMDLGAKLQPPGAAHWMGTDHVGRDILSRIIWGTRPSLMVGVGAVLIGLPIGIAVGLIAGFYYGGAIDTVLMRSVEVLASIPLLIWAIAIIGILGVKPIELGPLVISNELKIIVLIGILYVPSVARLTHAVAAVEAKADYVRARRVQGVSDLTIMVSDILPNCVSPLVVQGTLLIASGVLIEASLSFIGLGVQPPQPSLGGMLAEARNFIFSGEWWLSVFPGLAISLTVVGFNLFGDALRDILDPRRSTRAGFMG